MPYMSFLRFLGFGALISCLGACQRPAPSVQIALGIKVSALDAIALQRLVLQVDAPDMDPTVLELDPAEGSFELKVQAGSGRRFSVSGYKLASSDVPAVYGETTIDIEAGTDVELTLQATTVGLLDLTLRTVDGTPLPAVVPLGLEVRGSHLTVDDALDGHALLRVPAGEIAVDARFTKDAVEYASLLSQSVVVPSGERVAADVYLLAAGQKCSLAPAALFSLAPACRRIRVTSSGLGGAAVTLKRGSDALQLSTDGTVELAAMIAEGEAYEVTLDALPPDLACSLDGDTSGVAGTTDIELTLACTIQWYADIHGLSGAASMPVDFELGGSSFSVTANGVLAASVPLPGGSLLSALDFEVLTSLTSFRCVSAPEGNTLDYTGRTITIRCTPLLVFEYPAHPFFLAYVSDGSLCTGVGPPEDNARCQHSGEALSLELFDVTLCDGLDLSDTRDAFDWTCEPSGDHVRIRSVGLKPGVGLSQLVDWDQCTTNGQPCAFLPISVRVLSGTEHHLSPERVPWQNLLVRDDDLSNSSTGDYAIHLSLGAFITDTGVFSTGAGRGVVFAPGVTIVGGSFFSGSLGSWIEGRFSTSSLISLSAPLSRIRASELTLTGIMLSNGCHGCRVEDVFVRGTTVNYPGISIGNMDGAAIGVRIARVQVESSNGAGIQINGGFSAPGFDAVLEDVTVANSNFDGIATASGTFNDLQLRRVRSFNNTGHGIRLGDLSHTVNRVSLSEIYAFNNGGSGVLLDSAYTVLLAGATLANNTQAGLAGSTGARWHLSNVASMNNGLSAMPLSPLAPGFAFSPGTQDVSIDASAAIEAAPHLSSTMLTSITMHRAFFVDGPAACSTELLPLTCTIDGADLSSDWQDDGASDAVLHLTGDGDDAFVGFVPDDGTNHAGATAAELTDIAGGWTTYDRPALGRMRRADGLALFPSYLTRGSCRNDEPCGIFDFAAKPGGVLSGRVGIPGAPQEREIPVFAATVVDCSQYPGTRMVDAGFEQRCVRDVLVGAVEIASDDVGKDDGWCDPGDTCLTLQNVGADQGSGEPIPAGEHNFTFGGTATLLYRPVAVP